MNNIIEIWKKTIEVQQHFNDIELTIRNYALTIFSLIITAIGYTFKEDVTINLGEYNVILPVLIGYIGCIIIWAFYFMDRFWYHKLLIGAVKQAGEIEEKYKDDYPEMGLSTKIGLESPLVVFGRYEIHSSHKIDIFYYILIYLLLLSSTVLWVCTCCYWLNIMILVFLLLCATYHTCKLVFGRKVTTKQKKS